MMIDNLVSQDRFISKYTSDTQDRVNLAKNLSLILQDIDGAISITNSGVLLRNLEVNNNSVFSNFYEIITPQNDMLPIMQFDKKLSLKSSMLYSKLSTNSSDLVLYGKYQKSPLLELIPKCSNGFKPYICALYLELYTMYHELLGTNMISDIPVSHVDIARVKNNCYWINWYVQDTKDGSSNLVKIIDIALQCVNELAIFIEPKGTSFNRYTEHVIKDGDTLENISYRYFNTTDNIDEIISLNNLVYPYIIGRNNGFGDSVITTTLKAGTFKCGTRKSGEIVETWLGSDKLPTLYPEDIITSGSFYSGERCAGDTFGTPVNNIDDKQSAICGTFKCGTVKSGQTGISDEGSDNLDDTLFDGVVLSWGDTILLPILDISEEDSPSTTILSDISLKHVDNSLTNNLGGSMCVNECGDLDTVQEEEVVAQDIRHRMMCIEGDLVYHPEFGSKISEFIGNNSIGEGMEQKVVAEYTRTCLSDSRISKVTNIDCEISRDTIKISGDIKYMKKDILVAFTGSL